MNALVKTIPVTSRCFLKCKGTYFLTLVGINNVNIVMFGSKFLAIVTRFRDFLTLKNIGPRKKSPDFRTQNTFRFVSFQGHN